MGEVDGVPAQRHQLDRTQAMPVGDQHHGGVAMAVAIGPGGFDEPSGIRAPARRHGEPAWVVGFVARLSQ